MGKQIFGSGLATDINGERVPRIMLLLCNALPTTSFFNNREFKEIKELNLRQPLRKVYERRFAITSQTLVKFFIKYQ